MRRGFGTSELAVTILTMVGATAASASGILDPKYAVIASSVYTVCRTVLKIIKPDATPPQNDPFKLK